MKETKSTTPEVYVGLDVHKSSISIAYAVAGGSDPIYYGKVGGSNLALTRALLKLLKKLEVTNTDLRIAYEAGPTGFVAARRLLQLDYPVIVVAPSKIERASGERVKTDRKDALKLARLHRSGSLEGIHIPDATDEAIRDVCRARTDASDDRRKAKQRLLACSPSCCATASTTPASATGPTLTCATCANYACPPPLTRSYLRNTYRPSTRQISGSSASKIRWNNCSGTGSASRWSTH